MTTASERPRGPWAFVGHKFLRGLALVSRKKYTAGSLVIVENTNGEILVVQHRFHDRQAWGCPGGFLKGRETPHAAASRELREETGVLFAVTEDHLVEQYKQKQASHFEWLYKVYLPNDPKLRKGKFEIRDIAWIDPESSDRQQFTRETVHALGVEKSESRSIDVSGAPHYRRRTDKIRWGE